MQEIDEEKIAGAIEFRRNTEYHEAYEHFITEINLYKISYTLADILVRHVKKAVKLAELEAYEIGYKEACENIPIRRYRPSGKQYNIESNLYISYVTDLLKDEEKEDSLIMGYFVLLFAAADRAYRYGYDTAINEKLNINIRGLEESFKEIMEDLFSTTCRSTSWNELESFYDEISGYDLNSDEIFRQLCNVTLQYGKIKKDLVYYITIRDFTHNDDPYKNKIEKMIETCRNTQTKISSSLLKILFKYEIFGLNLEQHEEGENDEDYEISEDNEYFHQLLGEYLENEAQKGQLKGLEFCITDRGLLG